MKKNDLILMAREILEAAGSKRDAEARKELSPERQQTETSTIVQFE
jgi:hypothetical protein